MGGSPGNPGDVGGSPQKKDHTQVVKLSMVTLFVEGAILNSNVGCPLPEPCVLAAAGTPTSSDGSAGGGIVSAAHRRPGA